MEVSERAAVGDVVLDMVWGVPVFVLAEVIAGEDAA